MTNQQVLHRVRVQRWTYVVEERLSSAMNRRPTVEVTVKKRQVH